MSRSDSRPPPDPARGQAPRRPRGRRAGVEPEGDVAARGTEEARPGSAGAQPLGWTFRDFLVPFVLLVLSAQRAHGYFIEQYLRGLGLVNVEMSTLYRTLRQLEKDGLVLSTWEPGPDGPARRVYSLTDAGRWWLDASAAALESYRALIDRFFGSYPGQRPGDVDEDQKGGDAR